MKKRRIRIVIEDVTEVGGDEAFALYLEGDKERIYSVPISELTETEYWAAKLFDICMETLNRETSLAGKIEDRGCH